MTSVQNSAASTSISSRWVCVCFLVRGNERMNIPGRLHNKHHLQAGKEKKVSFDSPKGKKRHNLSHSKAAQCYKYKTFCTLKFLSCSVTFFRRGGYGLLFYLFVPVWLGIMLPVLGVKSLSSYAIAYLERLLL